MSFRCTMNPTGYVHGARHKNSAPQDNHSYCRLIKELRLSPDRLWPVTLWEPPGADPHARLCGGRGRKNPAYPIGHSLFYFCFVSKADASGVFQSFPALPMDVLFGPWLCWSSISWRYVVSCILSRTCCSIRLPPLNVPKTLVAYW